MADQHPVSEHPAPTTTDLALERTALAHDRTLMAWIRTAFSMISFGFTILKMAEYLKDSKALNIPRPMMGPRNLGATLIMLGTVSMVGATLQYWRFQRRAKTAGHRPAGFPLALVVALVISTLGILAFVGAFVRTGIF